MMTRRRARLSRAGCLMQEPDLGSFIQISMTFEQGAAWLGD
jgi:hypothetical protein